MNDKLDAYSLNVKFAENVIGELSQNKETGLLKLDYKLIGVVTKLIGVVTKLIAPPAICYNR
ncbi:hypothetical protein [uncultured Paraglaciecola sp.]|uniref:hypothetical protein n=1 Tax=uncultured Paraglaciecola sp. TaxID=1765024 RepID=UPI0030DCE0A6|tara:strand:+ start:4248 stop:4433 length:186 start_codon:yes stop_codon:yes gene_type:complete